MDTKSYHIVKNLLQLTQKEIWNIAKNQTESLASKQGWTPQQTQQNVGANYNTLLNIKYRASDAIQQSLTPDQRALSGLSDKEIREFANSQTHKQFAGQDYTRTEFVNAENDLYKQLTDQRSEVNDLLSGKKAHPNVDLALFDKTDIKSNQGLNEIREQLNPVGSEKIKIGATASMAAGLATQNLKEVLKNPISSIWNWRERSERNAEVMSGATLAEANTNLQDKKDRQPLKILSNFVSGNPDRQNRALKGASNIVGNFLSGEGMASKLIPAAAGFAGTKMAGFGNITSIIVALISALVLPMIMRAVNGNKAETTPMQGLASSIDNKQAEDAQQKMSLSREQSIQNEQSLHSSQEIERPSNNMSQADRSLNSKEMLAFVQQNGLCSLRTQMGADNPQFNEFVKSNGLSTALKAEEIGKFSGKSYAIAATSQSLAKTNTPVVPEVGNTIKTTMGIG